MNNEAALSCHARHSILYCKACLCVRHGGGGHIKGRAMGASVASFGECTDILAYWYAHSCSIMHTINDNADMGGSYCNTKGCNSCLRCLIIQRVCLDFYANMLHIAGIKH